jgi:hypothetical protein
MRPPASINVGLADRYRHGPMRPRVMDRHGRLPGLLLEWRRTTAGWQGRVVRPVLEASGWIVVEEWLPAELLAPA